MPLPELDLSKVQKFTSTVVVNLLPTVRNTTKAMTTKGTWDSTFSTYYWKMELNPLHEKNKVSTMTGYSSKDGHSEAQDKNHLLKRITKMLVINGYVGRSKKIEIFHRTRSLIEKGSDTLVLELLPSDYIVYEGYPYDRRDLIIFLKKIYNQVLEGETVKYLLPKPSKPDYTKRLEDDKMNVDKCTFYKTSDLQVYCEKLKSEGFENGAVNAFYRRYLLKIENMGRRNVSC